MLSDIVVRTQPTLYSVIKTDPQSPKLGLLRLTGHAGCVRRAASTAIIRSKQVDKRHHGTYPAPLYSILNADPLTVALLRLIGVF